MISSQYKFILLHEKDNVATALENIPKGAKIHLESGIIWIEDEISFGHKFAIKEIASQEKVYKYGVPIGLSLRNISVGQHVHLHNLRSMQKEGTSDEGLQADGWKNRNT